MSELSLHKLRANIKSEKKHIKQLEQQIRFQLLSCVPLTEEASQRLYEAIDSFSHNPKRKAIAKEILDEMERELEQ